MVDLGGSGGNLIPVIKQSMFPGFKFSPTDVELITYYLKNKFEGSQNSVEIIPEVVICRFEPWDLPGQSLMESENEWFFFSARGKKYPNGVRSKRATTHGYWKATGKEQDVKSGSVVVGTKRTLVFHIGRAPKGERTEWIMSEYRMQGSSQDIVVCRLRSLRKNTEFRGSSTRALVIRQGHSSADDENDKAFELLEKHTNCYKSLCSSNNVESTSENDQKLHNRTTLAGPSPTGRQDLSTSENEQKLHNRATLAGPSTTGKQDLDEDCFSEILQDEIIKLDAELLPAVATTCEAERSHWESVQTAVVRPGAEANSIGQEPSIEKQKSHDVEQALPNRSSHFVSRLSEKKNCILQFFSNNEQFIALNSFESHAECLSTFLHLARLLEILRPLESIHEGNSVDQLLASEDLKPSVGFCSSELAK